MKTIGIIGGASYASSLLYYRLINELSNTRLRNYGNPKQIYYNLNFQPIVDACKARDWGYIKSSVQDAAIALENAGADFIVISSNTLHKIVEELEPEVKLPILNIMDVLGKEVANKTILLLGTKYTVNDGFYADYLYSKFNCKCKRLSEPQQLLVNKLIFEELCFNHCTAITQEKFQSIIDSTNFDLVDGLVLGCTELSTPFKSVLVPVPVFDTVQLHVNAAVDLAFTVS